MKSTINGLTTLVMALLFIMDTVAQVGIGTPIPDSSSILDVTSTTKGMLIPRMTQAEIVNIVNPANGLVVFCTTDDKFYAYVNSANVWKEILFGSETIIPAFICGNPYTDYRDTTIYSTIVIGTQCWMAENLNIGMRINTLQYMQNDGIIEKYCYNTIEDSCDVYGGLYQWGEIMQYDTLEGTQGICPSGWHIPTDSEWCTLTTYLDNTVNCSVTATTGTDAGTKMKSISGWNSGGNGTNTSGFTGLPAGRIFGGTSGNIGMAGYFRSSTLSSGTDSWYWYLIYNSLKVGRADVYNNTCGQSVRCIKD
jgi:uncharacterized protein (TIGR02145 family)